MKLKNMFKLIFGIVLASSTVNIAMGTSKAMIKTNVANAAYASDVTTGSVLMNTNGSIRYISKGDNPDVWSSSTSETLNYGRFEFSDFVNKGGIANGWGNPASDGSGTLLNTPFTYTGRATNSMTFTESEASGQCVGLYIPICFYAASVPAYTKVEFKINIQLKISGGTSRNFVTAQLFHGGSCTDTGAKSSLPQIFYIPKNSDYIKTIGYDVLNIGQGDNAGSLSSTGTWTYWCTVANTTGTAKHMEAYYGGLFLGGRKDSTLSHTIKGSIYSYATDVTTTKYVATNTTIGQNYDTLATACSSAGNGDTVVLNSDVSSTNLYLNRSITLDLNGHDINLGSNLMSVYANTTVTLKGTGTIRANKSSAVVSNSGTLTVQSTVSIVNSYSGLTGYGISSGGTLNFAGSVTSEGNAIRTLNGTAYITGGTIKSNSSQALYLNGGKVYLTNTPTITSSASYADIYLNLTDSTLFAYNNTYYQGSKLTITLNALPAVGTIVVNKTLNNKFEIQNTTAHAYEFQYNSTTRNIEYVKCTTYKITYNANGGNGTLVDSNEYLLNEVATVLAGTSFTRLYYTFGGYSKTASATSPTYQPGSTITMTSDITLYVVWSKSATNYCDELSLEYLKMRTYDNNHDNTKGNGSCTTYYAAAKEFYLSMPNAAKDTFNSSSFADALARMKAWAKANGETFDPSAKTFVSNSATILTNDSNNNMAIIISVIAFVVIAQTGLILLKKKKHN